MVKHREPKASASRSLDPTAVERFAEGADHIENVKRDPNAPRTFKALRLPFNEYEWAKLEEGCERTGRSKLNFLRRAMLSFVDATDENEI